MNLAYFNPVSIFTCRINVIAASAYAAVSVFASSFYLLYLPHAVGHIAASLAVIASAAWCLHCSLLYLASGSKPNWLAIAVPSLLTAISGLACYYRYTLQT